MPPATATLKEPPAPFTADRIDPAPTAPQVKNSATPARRPRLSSHKWLTAGLAILLGVAVWQGYEYFRGPLITVDPVRRRDLVETVVASGNVEAPFRVNIASQIIGVVADVLVEEGAHVEKGQKLILLDDDELKAQRTQAEGSLAQAQARLRQLRELVLPTAQETLVQAQATALEARRTYDRSVSLYRNGHIAQAVLDTDQKNLDVAHTQVRAAQLQVYTSSPGGSDYVMAQTQLEQAHANLEAANSRLGHAVITAPRDGVLISRNVEQGSVVQPGTTLLTLSPSGTTQLVLDIDEKNLGRLTVGQNALASADAYPSQRFPARIAFINPGIDISRASVVVKLDVAHPPTYLVQDMTVSVDIEVARRDGALTVPRRDVHDLLSNDPWVLVESKGRALARRVRVGLIGDSDVEIVEGLAESDHVVPVAANLADGQRMRGTGS
ncbi:efflux RND transporter periplasmic adaptor subunit [Labrys sp. ZIDIC5]|uniref:efflux RND transporter periplasmic adaptor subunit n=1 Tax=Labrys sedimenti TaxID=3106036 RepID=UPI002ACA10AB|nr:efflux RND transporter periplasmic adaptor subunit [Labrys sp. ZIDIC5]MDZ5454456.1 efflux RND transporter periplasmic adaptor subunit [Labrys sp. ZIDIC5]